jgi:hypothetical protein
MKRYLIVALAVVGLVTPALAVTKNTHHHHTNGVAQAGASSYGTGNVQPYTFDPSGRSHPVLTPAPGPAIIPHR